MTLVWNDPSKKYYESGVSKTILYVHQGPLTPTDTNIVGVAWEGVTNITESPTGGEPTRLWANDREYGQIISPEKMEGKIEGYMWPEEFMPALGLINLNGLIIPQQSPSYFSISYKTRIHSDAGGEDVGYMIHFLYNMRVKPFERDNQTLTDSPEAATFSWDFTCSKVTGVSTYNPFSKITFDSRNPHALDTYVEDIIYDQGLILNPYDFFANYTPAA